MSPRPPPSHAVGPTTEDLLSQHDHPARRRRLLGVTAAIAMVGLSALTGIAHPTPALAQAAPGNAPDYAAEAFGDPWDYSNPEDQVVLEGQQTIGIQNGQINGGAFRFDVSGPSYFHFLWGGYPDSVPTNRDGDANPVDTSRFNRLVMKVTSSQYMPAGIRWYNCTNIAACEGGTAVTLEQGTHVYDVPLGVSSAGPVNWGGRIISMRMAFAPYGPTHVDVDWIRLTSAGGPVDEWAGPTPVIDDPDITGGNDYATVSRSGDAWDFNEAGDILRLDNIAGAVANGQLSGTNAGPTVNDPGVTMRMPVAFKGDDFHRVTVNFVNDGPFSLEDKVGGGANARMMWRIAGTPLRKDGQHNQVSRDVVIYPGQTSFTVDLKTDPSVAAVDPRQTAPKVGWAGQMIEMFRFDPNEDRGPRAFRVDNIKLADDDAGDTGFTIRLHDARPGAGTTVSLFADNDRTGFDGTPIAENVDLSSGSAAVAWNPPAGTKGTYWIYAVANRGGVVGRTYSTGPVRIGSPSGPASYQFGPAVGGQYSQVNVGAVADKAPIPNSLALVAGDRPTTTNAPKKRGKKSTTTTTVAVAAKAK